MNNNIRGGSPYHPQVAHDPVTGAPLHQDAQQVHSHQPGMHNPYQYQPTRSPSPSNFPHADGLPPRQRQPASSNPQPGVNMHPTDWDGVYIRTRPSDSKQFPAQVTEALNQLASHPAGHQLMQQIADAPMPERNYGYKVAIQPAPSTKGQGLFNKSRNYTGTNVTKAIDRDAASRDARTGSPGPGSASAISFNPQSSDTPHGHRPPYIGLGHELLHAHHNLDGTSYPEDHQNKDEDQVVGLGDHSSDPITENRLRKEHGLPPRRNY